MKVYFVGAGPGAADLITLRGAKLLGQVKMVLYAGSLVPLEMLQHCDPAAELIDYLRLLCQVVGHPALANGVVGAASVRC